MLASERKEFAQLVETLCSGFNVPCTPSRIDAYWRGCSSMHLLAFDRTVSHVLGPNGEEDLPGPRQMHTLHRRMVAEQRAASMPSAQPDGAQVDVFDRYTNRVLFTFLRLKARRCGSGATDESMRELKAIRKRYADAYRQMCIDEPEASLELRDALVDAFEPAFVARDPKPPLQARFDEGLLPLGMFA